MMTEKQRVDITKAIFSPSVVECSGVFTIEGNEIPMIKRYNLLKGIHRLVEKGVISGPNDAIPGGIITVPITNTEDCLILFLSPNNPYAIPSSS